MKIEIQPSSPAWSEQPADFESLESALRDAGFEVNLVQPAVVTGDLGRGAAGMDLTIRVLEDVGAAAVLRIVEALISRVWEARKRRDDERPVAAVIYGPKGEVLREVTIIDGVDRGAT